VRFKICLLDAHIINGVFDLVLTIGQLILDPRDFSKYNSFLDLEGLELLLQVLCSLIQGRLIVLQVLDRHIRYNSVKSLHF